MFVSGWLKNAPIAVKLADGRIVFCPDVCIGESELRSGDTLWRTHGFESLSVLNERGEAIGWVPSDAAIKHPERVKP